MLDVIVRGGLAVTPTGARRVDVAVQGERIVALALPGTLPEEGARVIDATGKIVVPGGVEAHAHIGAQMVNAPHYEISGPADVTRAAVFGGTTTVVDFAVQGPERDVFGALDERRAKWSGQSYIDYSWHCHVTRGFDATVFGQVKEAIASGFPSIKVFTTSVRPPLGPHTSHIDYGRLAALMDAVTAAGGILMVHSEDDEMVQYNYQLARDRNQMEWYYMHQVHDSLSEDISFHRVLTLAQRKNAAVYMAHITATEGVAAVAEARVLGQPVYGEALHNYLAFTSENYREPDGMKYHTYPALKSEDDRLTLWDGVLHGEVSTVATDHVSTTYEQKVMGKTVTDVTGGHNGIETRLGILYTEGVVRRGMSLERFVELTATNPARILGFYPRKGVLAPGSDADIAIIDPSIKRNLSLTDLHLVDYSIWDGWPLEGWPVMTILRGKVAVENGRLLGTPNDGQLIERKMEPSVLEKPVC